MLVASVAVNSLLATPEWFGHAVWNGVQPEDVIFPTFVTLTGCGLGFALHRGVRVWPLLRRAAILIAVGLLYNALALHRWDGDTWWLTGVLQLYAGVVLVLGLLHLITRPWVGWAVITVVLAAAQTALYAVWAFGCPDRALTPECNPSGVIDTVVFGAAHVYHQGAAGHDPVGLVALLGALISASAGATAGHLLLGLRARNRPVGPVAAVLPLLAVASACVLLAQLCIWLPQLAGVPDPLVMKRLWTAPFGLRVAAGAILAVLVGHLVMDRASVGPFVRVTAWPLVALGQNSLVVYFGSHALTAVLDWPTPVGVTVRQQLAESVAVGGHVQLTWTIAAVLGWTALACVLRRAGIFLRP